MKQRKIALGPGAASLILIIVVLSMCVLCMLTFISARNDLSLSTRSAAMVQTVYTLEDRSERSLARLDEVLCACQQEAADETAYLKLVEEKLPEGMRMEDGCIAWQEREGDRSLNCRVILAPMGQTPRAGWSQHILGLDDDTEETWN